MGDRGELRCIWGGRIDCSHRWFYYRFWEVRPPVKQGFETLVLGASQEMEDEGYFQEMAEGIFDDGQEVCLFSIERVCEIENPGEPGLR